MCGGEAPPKRKAGCKAPNLGCFCAYIAANERQMYLNFFFFFFFFCEFTYSLYVPFQVAYFPT